MVEQKKPGHRDRGRRRQLMSRVPDDQYAVYEAEAHKLGIPIGSYATMELAKLHKLPIPQYILDELKRAKERREAEAREAARDQIAGLDSLEGGRPLARSA
ncbi:hypothetical protein MZK47_14060 [Microbacterium aerolatum]|uniref:hypothetical protein n=1 Tax=Microbacterium TaxID=33882 RepID=UPI00097BF981|nr:MULTISPECIES: hypothetical protein [Microbacterium]MBS1908097.1 hypothetical protein [Actinomycetota bacterium]MCK3770801.1 hypothetical protein [Microbacterium aerolatum]ONI66749.1 hypothetical protein CSIV_00510 [Microbacterium sp. CSI-V]